jgi:hypothetical protein
MNSKADAKTSFKDMKDIALYLAQNGTSKASEALVNAGFDSQKIVDNMYHAIAFIKDGEALGIKQKTMNMIDYVHRRVEQHFNPQPINERLQHALDAVSKELMNERVNRGLTVQQAADSPSLKLSEAVLKDFHDANKPTPPREYTDEEKTLMGKQLASIFLLKRSSEHRDRFNMGEGHLTKTAVGVFNTVQGIGEDIQSGKFLEGLQKQVGVEKGRGR